MAVASMGVLLLVFWRIGLLLPKPENKTENLRNFHCAHPPVLFNKEFKCEGFYPLLNIFFTQPLTIFLAFALIKLGADGLPYQMFSKEIAGLPLVVQVLLGLLLIDISLWIRHSFVHKFLWSFHAVHHSAKELTWLTTRRLHPLDQIVMSLIDFVILYVAGFSAEGMVVALVLKDLNNLFVHSNIVLDYPKPLKYILVSPNMHRWHHATEKEAHDKNFCVVFAFVDYVMGTYYVPDNALPANYGSGIEGMDDIDNKSILKELWLPFLPARRAAATVSGGEGAGAASTAQAVRPGVAEAT
jgi:sterol desaturase/sphingolipid hydroxylase (fatty acid hydroxylase superfamily)